MFRSRFWPITARPTRPTFASPAVSAILRAPSPKSLVPIGTLSMLDFPRRGNRGAAGARPVGLPRHGRPRSHRPRVAAPRDVFLTANGLRLHLLEWGEAGQRPPILLLHGFQEHAHAWDWLAPLLVAAGHHVLALDLRGHGDSEWV